MEEYYLDTPLITYPNLFEAFAGIIEGKGLEPKVCYDYDKSITLLAEQMACQGGLDNENIEAAIESADECPGECIYIELVDD